ncbi:uncharacterized protein LOC101848262 [Aplysia californica]|uniref:Uncharacterized protein LOC101848262 n=1 Tax=Aplysia californica TaxID=6500 RepID=A0ABM0KAJ8_APLCA|nr:uncharacterized protein LOC101848262 [Aplysia californica]
MLVFRPLWQRIYIKVAYLTFAAIAGVAAGIAVIIFSVKLEEEQFELLWAPALPGVGGFLFHVIAIGGYLSWRNRSSDDDLDDRSEFSDRTSNIYEFSSSSKHRKDHGAKGLSKGYHRSMSGQSGKSDVL